jgi:Tol biopolymer transport system component
MNADGSDVVQLTDDQGNDFSPVWAPNGTGIAFMSERSGTPSIYLMDADGSQQAALFSDDNNSSLAPTFSYGTESLGMAFISISQGVSDLYVLDGATGAVTRLTEGLGNVLTPDWAQNGRFIVFAANPTGDYDLFIVKPDGTDFNQLTDNDVDEYKPRWSPDSNYIIYSVGQGEASEIAVRNEVGEVILLTDNDVFDGMPTWGPMP